MSETPLVSVGLQFFNNAKTLRWAIQSIVTQTYPNWELILHDDGSTDASRQVALEFSDPRTRFFADDANLKRPTRLNQSLDLARGKYYAIMDGDDVAYPDRLLKQVEYLEQHPEVDLLGAQMIVFDNAAQPIGRRRSPLTHAEVCAKPHAGFPMAQPTFCGRTNWFRKYYYDPRALDGIEDQDLLLRSHSASCFANGSEILMGYREPGLNLRKFLMMRYRFSQSLMRYCRVRGDWVTLLRGVSAQVVKSAWDIAAVGSGLKYNLLRHRALPITAQERDEWLRVWAGVSR
jgi:hypothetical protein